METPQRGQRSVATVLYIIPLTRRYQCRPELCDALPWFRSVQGGVYHSGNLCFGFLLDADCGIRSHIDDEVIITRV